MPKWGDDEFTVFIINIFISMFVAQVYTRVWFCLELIIFMSIYEFLVLCY